MQFQPSPDCETLSESQQQSSPRMQRLGETVTEKKMAAQETPTQPQWRTSVPAEQCHVVPAVHALPLEGAHALHALEGLWAAPQPVQQPPAAAFAELKPWPL